MILSIPEADKLLNTIQTFYIQYITENPIPENLFPHMAFFEDVNSYDQPVYCQVQVLSVNKDTKECCIRYTNSNETENIYLSAINIDWLKTIAERQAELNSTNKLVNKDELKILLRSSNGNRPSTDIYQSVVSFFTTYFDFPKERVQAIIGKSTSEQIIAVIDLLEEITLGQVYMIKWKNKSYKALDYSLNGVEYTISEVDLELQLMDLEVGDYRDSKSEWMDNQIQYYVTDDFWSKSCQEQKLTLIKEAWDN